MDENGLSEDFKKALADRYSSWELAGLLDIPVEDFITAFEEVIEDNFQELCEEMGYLDEPEDDE